MPDDLQPKEIKKRFKNKLFLAAAAALLFQVLEKNGLAPDVGTFQLAVDVGTYLLIGAGVYTNFDE